MQRRRVNGSQLREIGGFDESMMKRMSFETFDIRGSVRVAKSEQKETLKMAFESARIFANAPEGWLFLTGVHGCGKTHLAMAISNARLKQGDHVFVSFVPALLDHLRSTFSPDSKVPYDELFEDIKKAPLLVLDDLAAESNTHWAEEKLYQIIVYRHNLRLPTIITSALNADQIEAKEPGIGSRLKDQLVVQEAIITAPDYRDQQRGSQRNK
jgi:DNA replication protein DnaC